MPGERIRQALDREPVWRRAEERLSNPGTRIRNAPGKRLQNRLPQFPNRNFGGAVGVGVLEAGISKVLEETVGIPFGSDTEIVDSQVASNGTLYTVNVDAPFENMAKARAFFESNTGFTSLLTDLIEVESTEVLKTRTLRDTYQIEIMVED